MVGAAVALMSLSSCNTVLNKAVIAASCGGAAAAGPDDAEDAEPLGIEPGGGPHGGGGSEVPCEYRLVWCDCCGGGGGGFGPHVVHKTFGCCRCSFSCCCFNLNHCIFPAGAETSKLCKQILGRPHQIPL